MTLKRILFFAMIAMASAALHSCGGGGGAIVQQEGRADSVAFDYARNITLVDHDGYSVARMRNPWDTASILQTYILVDRDKPRPAQLPAGVVIQVPLRKVVVYSATHNALISELGAPEIITGVCEPQYIHDSIIVARLAAGDILDCGSSFNPDLERIMKLRPDAVLLSPYEGSGGHGKLSQLGIPLIECADYMEESPLARAEWMRFFGRLAGRGPEADSMFAATAREYNALRAKASAASSRPRVLMDRMWNGVWNVPASRSTMSRLIADAGGRNIFDNIDRAGSKALSPEQVLHEGHDADIWLVRYNQPSPLTLRALAAENPVYRRFNPFAANRVYGCNTAFSNLYDLMPFHPQAVLADMIAVFHPELGVEPPERFFTPLDE